MRRIAVSVTLALLGLALAPPALAEATKSLKLEMTVPEGTAYVVENLAGSMTVTRGTGDRLVAVATVHAESDALLSEFKFEQVSGEKGAPTLRAIYPSSHSTFRMPRGEGREDSWLGRLIGGGNSSTVTYAGNRVKVSESGGVLLYADIEVQLPAKAGKGTFRNLVGDLRGTGVGGDLKFDVASAEITLEDLTGNIAADAGSGNITATDISGSFSGDAGSGNITLTTFEGEGVSINVGSGNITARGVKARSIKTGTGSGNIRVAGADTEAFLANTGSGNVVIETDGAHLATADVDTGSGNVTLRLGDDASFEARASMSSGELVSDYEDAEPIMKGRELVGYRRGDGRAQIKVDTGSGNVRLEPGK